MRPDPVPFNLLRHIAHVTPLFWVTVGLAAVVGIGEIVLIALAVRGRTSGRLAVAAVAGPVLVALSSVAAIGIGHTTLLRGLTATDAGETFTLVLAGIEGYMNAQPLGLLLLGGLVALAAIAASLHAGAALALPTGRLVTLSLLFVGAGLGPFLYGALRYSTNQTKVLSGVAGIDPEMKAFMITRGLEETRAEFDRYVLAGVIGFGVALAFGLVTVTGASFRARPVRLRWRWPVVCLIAAAGLYAAAAPLRAETAADWPPSVCAALTINRAVTPDVDGPDPIPRAEVVTVADGRVFADGAPRTLEEWHDALVVMRNNYNLLHPDLWSPDENLVIVCPPATPTARLIEILRVAKRAEYRRPAFAFGKQTIIERPLLGKLPRWQWTAAKALIPGVGPETPAPVVTLTVADYPSCDAVARAIASVRRAGKFPGLAF
jgi:hypothetical protein